MARKSLRDEQWCRDATALSGQLWQYLKVVESTFNGRQWRSLNEW